MNFFLNRNCLLQTLKHVVATLEYVKSKGVEVRFHGRGKNEASHYCGQCEVSNISFFFFFCALESFCINEIHKFMKTLSTQVQYKN